VNFIFFVSAKEVGWNESDRKRAAVVFYEERVLR